MSTVEAPTIPVLESKLRKLEGEHSHLAQVRIKAEECAELKKIWIEKKDELKTAKGNLDTALAELLNLASGEPAKEDPQRRLPFVEEAEPSDGFEEDLAASREPVEPPKETKEPEILLPADIAALDISDGVKKALVKAGAKSVADVVDIGNKNWSQYPKGFASIQGIGPKAVTKLATILPSTSAPAAPKEAETKRIKILSFSAASPNLEPGKEYEATVLENGGAIVALPGVEPVQFHEYEYEVVESA